MTDVPKPQREPDWTAEDERALNNELPPRVQNQHSAPEVFYMTLGELDLELELVRKADYDSLFEQHDRWKIVALNKTQEVDRLQHQIDCANTPLMRDVLAERDGLKEQYENAKNLLEARALELEEISDQLNVAYSRSLNEQHDLAELKEQYEDVVAERDGMFNTVDSAQAEIHSLLEQLQAAQDAVEEMPHLWQSVKNSERKAVALQEQLQAADEFKAAMVRANQRQVDEITGLREQLETAHQIIMRWSLNPKWTREDMERAGLPMSELTRIREGLNPAKRPS